MKFPWIALAVAFVGCSDHLSEVVELEKLPGQQESSSSDFEDTLSSSFSGELIFVRSSSSSQKSSSSDEIEDEYSSSSAEPSSSANLSSDAAGSSSSRGNASITGCRCSTETPVIDLSQSSAVTWFVDGCVSESPIVHYEWGDMISKGPLATHYFSYEGETLAPKVVVYNDDKKYVIVSCAEVQAIEEQ